jgi:hypothetical protein
MRADAETAPTLQLLARCLYHDLAQAQGGAQEHKNVLSLGTAGPAATLTPGDVVLHLWGAACEQYVPSLPRLAFHKDTHIHTYTHTQTYTHTHTYILGIHTVITHLGV